MSKVIAAMLIIILSLQIVGYAWAWEIERPSETLGFDDDTVRSQNSDGKASVGLGVHLKKYEESCEWSGDAVKMNVSMTANSRKGLMYEDYWSNYWWVPETSLEYMTERNAVGDEWGAWIDIPELYAVRFYGGPGSAQYNKVWISSNGFIDLDPINLTCPNPQSYYLSPTRPNAVVAAVWSDLNVDNQASIITGLHTNSGRKHFVIIWKNVLHKGDNKRLTFEIILRDQSWYAQSHIWISYQSVQTISTSFAAGIEDQEGYKGNGGIYSGDTLAGFNGKTRHYEQCSHTFYLRQLKLNFGDSNPNTRFEIKNNDVAKRGYHVRYMSSPPYPEEDLGYRFLTALAGSATLLLGGLGGVVAYVCAGVDSYLVYMEFVDIFAYYQYSRVEQSELRDQFTNPLPQGAYITVPTEFECVDASLDIMVSWIMDDPNNAALHSMTVTATATYAEYDWDGMYISESYVSTSTNLKVAPDAGNDRSTARIVTSTPVEYVAYLGTGVKSPGFNDTDDYYRVVVPEYYMITTTMVPPGDSNFDLYLYYGSNPSPVASSTNPGAGVADFINYQGFGGTYYIRAKVETNSGFYDLSIRLVYHFGPPPPGPLSVNETIFELG